MPVECIYMTFMMSRSVPARRDPNISSTRHECVFNLQLGFDGKAADLCGWLAGWLAGRCELQKLTVENI